ncbi:uncharacterized protein [Diadema setosum]|uniref:uncharacterized protein n=1 Tax=Diadema setosum TaxID=31175 RepID=UPI003B3AC607
MTSTNSFVSSSNGEEWSRVLDLYEQVLRLKASKMKQASGKSLLTLDAWFQKELPKAIQQRDEKYITHEELAKLMEWKLTRGKFRPRLKEMVKTNSPELVEGASKKAFKKLPNVGSAIKELTVLKAVGPATASAVLAAGAPECAPFMADESMLAVPGCTPLAYTDSAYKRYCEAVQKCVARLNKDSSAKWTPHQVELALWTHYMANKLDPSILGQPNGAAPKRKGTDEKGEKAKKHKDK